MCQGEVLRYNPHFPLMSFLVYADWTSFFAGKHIILCDLFFFSCDEAFELLPDFRDGEDPATDVGKSGRALWGSTGSSLDTASLSEPLPDSELGDACVFGDFTFLMAGAFPCLTSSVSVSVSAPIRCSRFTRRAARCVARCARVPDAPPGVGVMKPACPPPPRFFEASSNSLK